MTAMEEISQEFHEPAELGIEDMGKTSQCAGGDELEVED